MSRVRSHGFITSEDESERENPPKKPKKKKKKGRTSTQPCVSEDVSEIKEILHLLCNKVDKNEQVLKEIQIARWSIVYY